MNHVANMNRGVLGERRFKVGHWAGSVLDSVMGVLLTQNVTDSLSSKAWMTLAATYPAQPMTSLDKGTSLFPQ